MIVQSKWKLYWNSKCTIRQQSVLGHYDINMMSMHWLNVPQAARHLPSPTVVHKQFTDEVPNEAFSSGRLNHAAWRTRGEKRASATTHDR